MNKNDNSTKDKLIFWDLIKFFICELKPRGKIFTLFNVITAPIILLGIVIIIIRFVKGLGATTNFYQEFPWGLWIGFNVITGVALAGGAYVLTFMVYILGLKKYHPIVRATVLNGFLAYAFYAGALFLDLGRPWHVVNPIIGNAFGVSSILFLVAWHFLLYMIAEFIEFSPAIAEWLGLKRIRKIVTGMTIGAVIFGITLSTLHQSGLGALFLLAKSKIHPLWYTEFIPLFFFVSSIFAGMSMVIIEGTISHGVFKAQIDPHRHASFEEIVVGLGKVATGAMFAYLGLKILDFVHGQKADYILTGWGLYYLVEIIGFVFIPFLMFLRGVRKKNINLIRIASIFTVLGIIINRLNFSMIAYQWNSVVRYYPLWMEVVVSLCIIFIQIWVFRWVVNRMPVLKEHPDYIEKEFEEEPKERL